MIREKQKILTLERLGAARFHLMDFLKLKELLRAAGVCEQGSVGGVRAAVSFTRVTLFCFFLFCFDRTICFIDLEGVCGGSSMTYSYLQHLSLCIGSQRSTCVYSQKHNSSFKQLISC